jgi:hypothetical protein
MSNLVDDCKKYLGKAPYDSWSNIVMGDSYFYKYMCDKYGEQDVEDAIKRLK